jgi:hypothetical protein
MNFMVLQPLWSREQNVDAIRFHERLGALLTAQKTKKAPPPAEPFLCLTPAEPDG